MIYGYARVSTDKQDVDNQVRALREYTGKHRLGALTLIEETAGGTKERPKLEALLNRVHEGDTVLTWELSRLTRGGVGALFAIAERIRKAGARLIETKANLMIDGSVQSEALVFALGLAARIERDLIAERTRNALRARRAAGVKLGRPKGPGKSRLDAHREQIVERLGFGVPIAKLARDCGVTAATMFRYVERRGLRPVEKGAAR